MTDILKFPALVPSSIKVYPSSIAPPAGMAAGAIAVELRDPSGRLLMVGFADPLFDRQRVFNAAWDVADEFGRDVIAESRPGA